MKLKIQNFEFEASHRNIFNNIWDFLVKLHFCILLQLFYISISKFHSIHTKTSVFLSAFNKIAELKPCKETPTQVLCCEYCKSFKNTSFAVCLWWLLLWSDEILQGYLLTFFLTDSHHMHCKNTRNIFDVLKCTFMDIFKLTC